MHLAKQKMIDRTLGTLLCLLLGAGDKVRPLKAGPDRKDVRSILFIKFVALGDAVLLLPVLRHLKEGCPRARITVLTTGRASPILERSPDADEVLVAGLGPGTGEGLGPLRLLGELRRRRFDLAFDLEQYYRLSTILAYLSGATWRVGYSIPGQPRGALFTHGVPYRSDRHEFLTFLDVLGGVGIDLPTEPKLVPLPTTERERAGARQFLADGGWREGDLLVGLHPGSGPAALSRRWPAAGFAEVGDWVIERHGARVVITGGPDEIALAGEIAALMRQTPILTAGRTTLGEFASLLAGCDLVVSNDSGPMHLAAAMGSRVVGLFGPNIPEKWRPWGAENRVVQERMSCSPCTRLDQDRVSDCRDNQCMKLLSPRKVMSVVDDVLARRG